MRVPETTLVFSDDCSVGWRGIVYNNVVEVGIVSPLGTVTIWRLIGKDMWIPTQLIFVDGYTIDLTEGETL